MAVCILGLSSMWASARADTTVAGHPADVVVQRALALVNDARSHGRRCGSEYFPAAPPLAVSEQLRRAAQEHAQDMARHGYFEHAGRDGSAPRDRLARTGYSARLTGENIAYGPESAEEAVAGWLASPGHCANIMDARFRDSALAFAIGARHATYWVQVLASPRSAR